MNIDIIHILKCKVNSASIVFCIEKWAFYQIRGGEITYQVKGNLLTLSRTNRSIL